MRYKILLIVKGRVTAIEYYRQLVPHNALARKHPEFEILQKTSLNEIEEDVLKTYQAVQFSREISLQGETERIVNYLHKLGLKVIFDIDDYWKLDKYHALYDSYKGNFIPQQTEEAIRLSDHVTCTTEIFADEIRSINKNVTVLPNTIDPTQDQYRIRDIESPRLRFGWVGGVHHGEDIELLRESFKRLYKDKEIRGKWQLCLAGFNVENTKALANEYLKEGVTINQALNREYYVNLEKIFTQNYSLDKDYVRYLMQLGNTMEHYTIDQDYRRIWNKPIGEYVQAYNEIDVALVPLRGTPFNAMKSQLKIIEAGFMQKAVIVSGVNPYLIDCVHMDNCLMVKPERDFIDWHTSIRRLVKNKSLYEDLRWELHYYVKERYHIDKVNETRKDLYEHLLTSAVCA